MSAQTVTIVKGARWPVQFTLTNASGAIGLAGCAVTMSMHNVATGAIVCTDVTITITTPASGIVTWSPGATETTTLGRFLARFKITSGGVYQGVPNDCCINIIVVNNAT